EKVQAVKELPIPKTAKQAVSFVKAAEYYRRFISRSSEIAPPLHKFSSYGKYDKFKWGFEEEEAFN
ncbi:unnamed protein product, partial [Didymodactylos carnosus]